MIVSLFTVRIVLQALGQVDYGLYNVVGGIVVMFSFLSHVLSSASQRFFSFELGRGDTIRLSRIYSIILMLYAAVIAAIVFLAETVGLWFLHAHMTIPPERMIAVEWVYQLSIAGFCVQILTTPHKALIIAKERMNIYAYVGIIEVVLQLLLAYTLLAYGGDRLLLYAVLMFAVHAISNGIYIVYARWKYRGIRFAPVWDGAMVRSIIDYSGWTLFGALASIARSQGLNIILNVYFGAVVNAARGIAHQVNTATSTFAGNFYTAVKPQIVKLYAQGKYEECYRLVFDSTKLAFVLVYVLALPLICYTPDILRLWLKEYPDYAVVFTRLILVVALANALANPLITFNQATGNIKAFQIVISTIYISNIPLSIIAFECGAKPVYAFIISIGVSFLALSARIIILRWQHHFPAFQYIKKVLIPILTLVVVTLPVVWVMHSYLGDPTSIVTLLLDIVLLVVITLIFAYSACMDKSEKQNMAKAIKQLKGKIWKQ
jgi:O-antigen/teichoic acid export membrane protein